MTAYEHIGLKSSTLGRKRVPEPYKLIAELSQVFIHGETAFFKNTISFFDYLVDHVPGRQDHIDGYTGLLRAPDKRLAKETDAVPDTICICIPCFDQVTCNPFRFNAEKIFQDFLVLAFPEHVTVMSIRVHLFKLRRDNTAGPENYYMVA